MFLHSASTWTSVIIITDDILTALKKMDHNTDTSDDEP